MGPLLKCIFSVTMLSFFGLINSSAAPESKSRNYSTTHPLVYEDSWDLWPYSFLNEDGEPDGFNIDLLKLMLNELDIPYIIKLKSNQDALNDLRNGKSDLRMALASGLHDEYGLYGRNAITLFTQSVVSSKSAPTTIRTFRDLSRQKVIVYKHSLCHHLMQDYGWGENAIPYEDINEALQTISNENQGQVVWNTLSLKWLLNKYQMENLQMTNIEMPPGEYKFMSNDQRLLDQLDSIYTVLYSADMLTPIQNKWFYPERQEKHLSKWFWLVTGGLSLLMILLLFYLINYHIQGRQIKKEINRRNKRLSTILQASQTRLWTYDIKKREFTWYDESGKPAFTSTADEFARYYNEDDCKRMTEALERIIQQEEKDTTLHIKGRDAGNNKDDERDFAVALSVLRCDKSRHPIIILGTNRDITEELKKQREEQSLLLRYKALFETTMVDVIFYDKDGYLTDLNKKACETFRCDHDSIIAEHITFNAVMRQELDSFDLREKDSYYTTLLINFDKKRDEGRLADSSERQGKMYYELLLKPVYNDQHQFMGTFAIGRDRTATVNSINQIRQNIERLTAVNKELTDYVENINYILRNSGVRMVEYSPTSHTLSIYSAIDEVQYAMTQTRCMTLVDERYKMKAMLLLNSMDNRTTTPIDTDIRTMIRAKGGLIIHLEFHFIPVQDETGVVTSYLGLCRNITELKATEQQLEQEIVRAQEVESTKNSFLRNMSYEIRTPLNAVVGFAELFDKDHTPEDETLFVQEILDNSDRLLHLINNILFLSRIDAHMIEIKPQATDFALLFEGYCHNGWTSHRQPGVRYIVENPYNQLIVNIDANNLEHVIRNITENAALHTTSGSIRCRYDYVGWRLLITIEDTGCGIEKNVLDSIFMRFTGSSHGSGLGLAICKELIEQMGGSIELNSEVGMGTTVWITLPCQATAIKRKNTE